MTDVNTPRADAERGGSPTTEDRGPAPAPRFWRRLLAWLGQSPTAMLAVLAVLVMTFLIVFGPVIWGSEASRINLDIARQGPSGAHPLGTDNAGRDVLARMLASARLSLGLAMVTALAGASIGIPLGAVAGVLGPRMRRLVGEGINVVLAFPGILVALFMTAVFGTGVKSVVLALSVASAPSFARLAQTLAVGLARADFVAAARVAGYSRRRILFRHILPNVAEPLVLTTTLAMGSSLLAFAALSFLGLGIQPPDYDWGRVLNDGLQRIYETPAAALGAGAIIVLAGLAFNLVGDTLAVLVARPGHRATRRGTRRGNSTRHVPTPQQLTPPMDDHRELLLDVRGLKVSFGDTQVIEGIDLTIRRGERLAIVGESGSGKTLAALAAAMLPPADAVVQATTHTFDGRPMRQASAGALGTGMAFVFQDPMSSWNPALRMGVQIIEAAVTHEGLRRRQARERATELLSAVRVTSPNRRIKQYPHELSGGMRQRCMIASGLMTDPALVIADEPTTALDVTVQEQVLRVLTEATVERGAALLLITHDLGVVAEMCERVLVMYAGRVVEDAPFQHLVDHAEHPYTHALLGSMPDLDTPLDEDLVAIPGSQPEPGARPTGCAFRDRCMRATALCQESPPLAVIGPGHRAACWHPIHDGATCVAADKGAVT